jgi:8-oxo-dGTP pyrophosphatase MutT (NUDIX family)
VSSGEKVEAALKREAEEELGLRDFNAVPMGRYVWESEVESELVHMFVTRTDRIPRINPEEISEGKFWKIGKIKEARSKGILTPNFEFEFDILLKHVFREP